ncbi:uncharacterized protein, partial [Chamaea fasciata]|uniref:uncharacterized protein n=1 Tax=Chamaea fasciata TaxID=190680 RepID=UPI003369EE10
LENTGKKRGKSVEKAGRERGEPLESPGLRERWDCRAGDAADPGFLRELEGRRGGAEPGRDEILQQLPHRHRHHPGGADAADPGVPPLPEGSGAAAAAGAAGPRRPHQHPPPHGGAQEAQAQLLGRRNPGLRDSRGSSPKFQGGGFFYPSPHPKNKNSWVFTPKNLIFPPRHSLSSPPSFPVFSAEIPRFSPEEFPFFPKNSRFFSSPEFPFFPLKLPGFRPKFPFFPQKKFLGLSPQNSQFFPPRIPFFPKNSRVFSSPKIPLFSPQKIPGFSPQKISFFLPDIPFLPHQVSLFFSTEIPRFLR